MNLEQWMNNLSGRVEVLLACCFAGLIRSTPGNRGAPDATTMCLGVVEGPLKMCIVGRSIPCCDYVTMLLTGTMTMTAFWVE